MVINMRYVICDDCGGYYELQKGESPGDFEACNCGGNLSYTHSINSIPKMKNKPKNTLKCRICGHEQLRGLKCSKCGSSLRKVNYRNINDYGHYRRNKYDLSYVLEGSSELNFFERIEWRGVTSGIIFYIVASIVIRIVSVMFLGGSFLAAQNVNSVSVSPIIGGVALIFGMISALIPVASGFWAVTKITTRDYITGIINGGMVGVILGIIIGIFSLIFGLLMAGLYGQVNVGIIAGFMGLIIGIIYGGLITAIGGLIAVLVRRYTSII